MAALSAKDLDWSRENLSAGMNQESGNTKKKDIKPAAAHPNQKLNRIKKVIRPHISFDLGLRCYLKMITFLDVEFLMQTKLFL